MKLLIFLSLILSFNAVAAAQITEPTPTPPTAPKTAKTVAREKAAKKKLPAGLSDLVFTKNDESEHINFFLVAHHSPNPETVPPKFEVCFDYIEKFWEKRPPETEKVYSLYLQIDGSIVVFPLPDTDKVTTNRNSENEPFVQWRHFNVFLTLEEAAAIKNALNISVIWNRGNFEISPNGFAAIRKFFNEEMPKAQE